MAFYRSLQKNKGLAYDNDAFAPSAWDYIGASAEQAWIDSPFSSMARIGELNKANGEKSGLYLGQGMGFQPFDPDAPEPERMSVEAQTKRIDEAGLALHLKAEEGFTPEALDIVIERKKEEIVRQNVLAYDMPWYVDTMAFGAELGTAMLDPINIASAYVPVIGEARALAMMTRGAKQGALALAKQRAKIGFTEGLVGAAMLEPLTHYAHDQEQADYDMYDSLINVLSGGVFGATIQPSFGAIGDAIRKKRGGRAPWEMLSPTEESERLRQTFVDQAYSAYISANPNGKREEIVAAASIFDARARAHAYDVGSGETGVHDYYAKHMPRFEVGNVGEGDLQQGHIALAEERLQTDAEAWALRIDEYSQGTINKNKPVEMLSQTPLVMQMAGAKALPVEIKIATLNKIIRDKHGLSADTVKQVPQALANPVMIFDNPKNGNLVVMLELKDAKGATVVVPVALDMTSRGNYQVNEAKSIYGRRTSEKSARPNEPNNQWFIDEIDAGNLLYIDHKKSHDWADPSGLSLPTNFNRRDAKNIYTDADLVKLKERNPALYQDGVSHNTQKNARYSNEQKTKRWQESAGVYFPIRPLRNASGNTVAADADHVNLKERNPALYQAQQQGNEQDPRGAISFGEDGRAVIKFFSHADASTLPHELFHVFRREMMESALDASASPAMKERYGIIEDFVGAKSGEPWTPEMEEKFATAAERYFLEGIAPSPELKGVFAKLKQWLTEIYTSLELNKVPISDNMRKVFGEMLVPSFTESDVLFRKQMGEMLSYDSLMARASEYERGNTANFDVDSNQVEAIEEGIASAEEELMRSIDTLAMTHPELGEGAKKLYASILEEADAELGQLDVRRQMEKDAIACELGR